MAEKRVIRIPKIPEGNRFEKYLKELEEIMKGNKSQFIPYLQSIFRDCLEHIRQNQDTLYLPPQIALILVPTSEEFKAIEQTVSKKAVSKEDAKYEARALVVGNKFAARIHIDVEKHIELLTFGGGTFILNIVETYIHEILHTAFPEKYEQEIHDMQCSLLDEFLGVKLKHETRNIEASDYYSKKA